MMLSFFQLKNEFSIDKHFVKNPFYEKQFSFDFAYWSVTENDRHFTRQEQVCHLLPHIHVNANSILFSYNMISSVMNK